MNSPATIPLIDNINDQCRALGCLVAGKVSFPLSGVDIKARVVDRISNVTVKQVFKNTFTEHLEAVYIFPLAAGCAVSSFNMKVGDRVVRGVVQERAQARQTYQQAISDGKRAALMEQERDDVFTVQVGNIPPGQEVTIEITYSERLPFFDDGKTELRLPLVVSPRYIPGAAVDRDQVGYGTELDTDQVPDASRITPPRLAPGLDPQVSLKLEVELLVDSDAESLSDLSCSQHTTKMSMTNGDLLIALAKDNERLNRDFVLRWTMTAKTLKSTMLAYKAEDGQVYGMLSIVPPAREGFLGAPRDVVFVVDRSGSMNGIKMTSAVRACTILANTLSQRDRFAILAFDNAFEWMPVHGSRGGHGDRFIYADEAGLEQAEKYLRTITARGGTELDGALNQALQVISARAKSEGRTVSLVVLTDGEVGNESYILQRIQRQIGDARVFAVGIDTSVNSGLLKRLAALGGGTAAFVEPGIQLEEALASVARDIGHPLVSDLQVDGLDLTTVDRASISPSRIPDTFAGRASMAFFKLNGDSGRLVIKGKYADGKPFEQKVKIRKTNVEAVAQLWAKTHIVDLEDLYRISNQQRADLKQKIVALAVKHSLLTKFTAFVVVDEAEIVNKTGDVHTVVQPVEMPDQWAMNQPNALPGRQASSLMGQLRSSVAPQYFAEAGGASSTGTRLKSLSKMEPSSPAPDEIQRACMSSPMNDQSGSAGDGTHGWVNWSNASECQQPSAQPPAPAAWGAPQEAKSQVREDAAAAAASQEAAAEATRRQKRALEQPSNIKQGIAFSAPSPSPAPQPSQTPPAPGVRQEAPGSYGSGVRAQVFEVIVRQAMNGAPWREICAGPMQVNSITEQEVEAEMNRRQAILGKPQSKGAWEQIVDMGKTIFSSKPQPPSVSDKEVASVKAILSAFLTAFTEAYILVEKKEKPSVDELEALRQNLIQKLAPLNLGTEMPVTQRFLRSTAIQLIASLKDQNTDADALCSYWSQSAPDFQALCHEVSKVLGAAMEKKAHAFWEASI